MRHPRHFGNLGSVLLAILLAAAGVPAAVCAAMADCPMAAPADDPCAAPGGDPCCPLPGGLAGGDHCDMMDAQPPIPAPSSDAPVVSLVAGVPVPMGPPVASGAADRPVPGASPPLSRPGGRALLSLQQTLLI